MTRALPTDVDVAIIGAGFGGICAAAELLRDGEGDIALLERAGSVGGCWRDNTYPGCQCDVPTALYSYSFLAEPSWSRTYPLQPEIWGYLQRAVARLGIEPVLHLDTDVLDARWDETIARWRIDTSRGPLVARVLVGAAGPLTEPSIPDVAGIDTFEGEQMHSARWREDVELAGRRVAIVGAGASAIQIAPRIQPDVERLVVFQRTPPWVLPHRDRRVRPIEQVLWRRIPLVQRAARLVAYWSREALVPGFMRRGLVRRGMERVGRRHLARQVPDAELRERLPPTYLVGCKRVLLSNEWYPTLAQPNVDVVTSAVTEVRARSIVAADGSEHEVDVIVWATGFEVTDTPIARRVHGRRGTSLAQEWQGSPRAHRGTFVTGFPNLVLLVGPNTGLGHNSIVFMIETQVRYLRRMLRSMRRAGIEAVDARAEAQRAWNDRVDARMSGTVWTSGGCSSWYLDDTGRNSTLWPGSTWRFRQLLRRADLDEFEAISATAAPSGDDEARPAAQAPAAAPAAPRAPR
jgi:cation diffusion facilitator CzcD-associated flavoprotein CzcO